ncbi:MAG: YndJ family transporter [Saprospiraceae bacterium]
MRSFKKIYSFRFRLVLGGLIWLGWSMFNFQSPLHANWGRMLLLLAPLVIVPLALNLLSNSPFLPKALFIKKIEKWTLPAAACLVVAYMLSQGALAGALALPWLAVTLAVAWLGISSIHILKTDTSLLASP